jgi:alpha-ribazole phosphatase
MKLHLVRHPRPDIDPGLCYGATDVPVAQQHLAEALTALRGHGLPGPLPVYASPLRRCAELARRLQPRRLHLDARLAEMDFGRWEMRPWTGIPMPEVDAWAADLLTYRPGGAENVLDVARRVAAFVDDLRGAGVAEALVICHAGTIRLLGAMHAHPNLEQAALQAAATPHRIAYGDVILLEV